MGWGVWRIALTGGTLGVIGVGAAGMGARLPGGVLLLWGVGAVAAQAAPRARTPIAVAVGAAALALVNPVFCLYVGALVAGLAATRRRLPAFALLLAAGALVWPKLAFSRHYHQPGYWSWLEEPNLAAVLFLGALWVRTRADARRSPAAGGAVTDDAPAFLLLFFFPSYATHPMVLAPSLLARPPQLDPRATVTTAAWFAAKVLALTGLARLGPHALLRNLTAADAAALGRAGLWGVVLASYVETCLALAAAADIPILVGRLYGFPLPDPFRAPLIAWNPVELWRRWGIYNRRLLLALVYFPLGGNQRYKYRNVALTFLASALVLHTGWFGSKYWEVGAPGWRDQSLYFGLQAVAVCGYLYWRDRRPAAAPAPFWSWRHTAGLVATQAWSALAHVVVLAQGIDLPARFRMIGRCLGL
jgi:hypothetical protein